MRAMGRGAKGVNDLLPPHERVFGKTRPGPSAAQPLARALAAPGAPHTPWHYNAGVCRPADPDVGDREEEAAELLEKIDRVPGFAIAFLLDEGSVRPGLRCARCCCRPRAAAWLLTGPVRCAARPSGTTTTSTQGRRACGSTSQSRCCRRPGRRRWKAMTPGGAASVPLGAWLEAQAAARTLTRPRSMCKRARSTWRRRSLRRRWSASRLRATGAPARTRCPSESCSHRAAAPRVSCALVHLAPPHRASDCAHATANE